MKSRRAQITIFIILAIVILLVVALVFYVRMSSIKVKPPVQQLEVNDEIKPIQNYVTECLSTISKEALIKLGNNGGYTELTGMKISPQSYNSDVFVFDPQKIPYWYYLKDCKDSTIGCLQTKKPALCQSGKACVIASNGKISIQEQLNNYIEKNIPECINNFEIFQERFDIKTGEIKADSIVTETGVYFKLDYPLDITVKSTNKNSKDLTYFVAEHNVKLKEMYELASEIYEAEMNYHFLEVSTMNLIAIYSDIDSEKLPPTSGLTFITASTEMWTRSKVQQQMQEEVLPYLNFIQILGTRNAQSIITYDSSNYSIYAQGIYRSMEFKLSNKTYFDLDANIIYPYSDIYLKIGNSEVIKPDRMKSDSIIMKMIGFFMTEYKFKYDISYPVIIKLNDPEAFNGEGYEFNYAMEANIRQNVPVDGTIKVIDFGGIKGIELDSELQKVNRTITIETIDKHTKEPLEEVIITYQCGESFLLGQTEIENGKAVLKERFPYCALGGKILYEKQGYMGSSIDYNNPEGSDAKSFKLELWPLQEKNIVVYKRTPSNLDEIRKKGAGAISLYSTAVSNITNNESVFLSLNRIKQNPDETDVPLVGFTMYKSEDSNIKLSSYEDQKQNILKLYADGTINETTKTQMLFDLEFLKDQPEKTLPVSDYKMDFVPGTYDIDAFMMYQGNIHIPAETRKICVLKVVVCLDYEEIDLPEQTFDTWVNGGAKLNFTLTERDVYSDKNTLTFYVLEQPNPYNWATLETYQDIETYQIGKLFLLKPRLD